MVGAVDEGRLTMTGQGHGDHGVDGHVHGYAATKDAHLKRLRRIEGQVRGVQRMIDDDVYCIDILTQVSAVTKALESMALVLLDEHLRHCVTEAIQAGGDEADAKVGEASAAIARLVRS
jgi:DNA-binding FrmR family transcriptional regulator